VRHSITGTDRTYFVLFYKPNRIFGPCLTVINRILNQGDQAHESRRRLLAVDSRACRIRLSTFAGDQTSHLLHRLRNGETPQRHLPKVVVLHICANDVAAASGAHNASYYSPAAIVGR
jgi:hypothetical protein